MLPTASWPPLYHRTAQKTWRFFPSLQRNTSQMLPAIQQLKLRAGTGRWCVFFFIAKWQKLWEGFDRKVTGGAKAASRTAPIPVSGCCRRFRVRRIKNANRERHGGSSRMMRVSTTPGSIYMVVLPGFFRMKSWKYVSETTDLSKYIVLHNWQLSNREHVVWYDGRKPTYI